MNDLKEEKQELLSSSEERPVSEVKLYKLRWIMLLIFSLNSMMNAALFISLGAINNIVSSYYGVSSQLIDWLCNSFLLMYTILAIPASFLMGYFGLKPILLVGSFFNFICTCFRFAGRRHDDFPWVIVGQLFAALGYCTILQVPARLSSIWFGDHERNLASSIGAFMNIFGVSLGFLMSSQMVKESVNINEVELGFRNFFLAQMIMSCVFLALVFFVYRERPPTPSSVSLSVEEGQNFQEFVQSLKCLCTNLKFNIMAQSYALYFGLFNAFSVILNTLVTSHFKHGYETLIGWMGFSCDVVSIPSTFVLGLLLDKYHQYRCQAVTLNSFSLLIVIIFNLVLTKTTSFAGVFVLYAVYGLFGVPYFCTGLEQAAVMTYPVAESTSSAFILSLGNLYAFILVLVLGHYASSGNPQIAGYIMAALYAISIVLSACTSVPPRDEEHEDNDRNLTWMEGRPNENDDRE